MFPAHYLPRFSHSEFVQYQRQLKVTPTTYTTSAIQRSGLAIPAVDARREATILETTIYDEAQSPEDYSKICDERVEGIAQQIGGQQIPEVFRNELPKIRLSLTDIEDAAELVPSEEGVDIGRFKNATYHKEGLFSVVYKAAYLNNEPKSRFVALKVTTPSSMEPPHDSRREAQILELSVSDHVIPLLETFREAGTRFVLVLPFMPFDLHQLLEDQKLSEGQTKSCLRGLFSALTFIHSHGIIHRDIKPSNILLKSLDGPSYLSDFGIAWAPNALGSEAVDKKITDVGTTCYRAPELLFGNTKYDYTLDLWAAGCTIAEAIVPGHPTLFDSGELGSDLALIQSIFSRLGTPNLTVWPEAAGFHDWGKMQFHEYPPQSWPSLLPNTSEIQRNLISSLVQYESRDRITAAQVLEHPYFV